jgi:hypothetical protein
MWSALFDRLKAVGSGMKSGPDVAVGGKTVEDTERRVEAIV